ncbi:MAG: phosphodiesterase [Lachnospiraceae bacterium]|nr:phosphodiesterase [Lachnospiraceae bacterium]
MKIMIASDVHGSFHYCREMLKAFDGEKADKLLLLGDILYHGPRNDLPGEYSTRDVAAMLNERKNSILCVKGNCDSEVDQMMLEFPIMAEYCLLYVKDRMIFATHGHHFNKFSLPPLAPGDILLHGHTHVPAWEEMGGNNLYLNPGSVSIPKEDSRHGYMILDDNGFVWKDMEGAAYHDLRL